MFPDEPLFEFSMRRSLTTSLRPLAMLFVAFLPSAAAAHLVVDVGVSLRAPAFAPRGSAITYNIDVSDLAYDFAYGVVVSDQLGSGMKFTSAQGDGWNCTESGGTVTCSAETRPPGTSTITVIASAPATPGSVTSTATVTSLGSVDPNGANDTTTAQTVLYDPAACSSLAATLLTPLEQATLPNGLAALSWSAVPGAVLYRVWISVEGAQPSSAGQTSETSLSVSSDAGWNEWWVEAIPDRCPTASSTHGHFFSQGRPIPLYISDYAGQAGLAGFTGGTLSDATFVSPVSLAIDMFGTMWIADMGASTIRRIAKGIVTTIAGEPGVTGSDDGPAISAELNHPRALTVGAGGDAVYIADTDNQLIRVLYPSGNGIYFGPFMATLAGSPGQQGTVDGVAEKARFTAPAGIAVTPNYTIYVGDTGTDRIRRLTQGLPVNVNSIAGIAAAKGTNDGPAAAAQFNGPTGVALDANGNIFVSDTENDVIRRIGTDGFVTTVAGAPGAAGFIDGAGAAARFNRPTSLAFDLLGNLYVADTGNHAIRRIAPSHLVSTLIGTGVAGHKNGAGTTAMLSSPTGLAFDASGLLYIADTGNNVIRVATTTPPAPSAPIPRRRAVTH
jgi:sugar lactone lactonase YvrE